MCASCSPATSRPEDGANQRLHRLVVQLVVVHGLVKHVIKPAGGAAAGGQCVHRAGGAWQPCTGQAPRVPQAAGAAAPPHPPPPTHLNMWRSVYLVRSTLVLGSFTYRHAAALSHSSTSASLRSSSCEQWANPRQPVDQASCARQAGARAAVGGGAAAAPCAPRRPPFCSEAACAQSPGSWAHQATRPAAVGRRLRPPRLRGAHGTAQQGRQAQLPALSPTNRLLR